MRKKERKAPVARARDEIYNKSVAGQEFPFAEGVGLLITWEIDGPTAVVCRKISMINLSSRSLLSHSTF